MVLYGITLFVASLVPLISFLSNWSLMINFSLLNIGVLTMSFSVLLDKQASLFIFTVALIFLMVFVYSFSYLSNEIYLKRFLSILGLFAASMCLLIISGNLFNSLIGWDGLGVTSLFLILFYYSNSALKASTLTFLMNRVGDCFFILTLTSFLLLGEEQTCYTASCFAWQLSILLILTSITKSAQIPFSTWLPAAMEAPTPVSALVHSSTLVTAGIFLLYRYSEIWIYSSFKDLLLVLSVGTCFMAALSALTENDLKKLIALSTLSQLGFIMFSFSLGMLSQGFLHMIMHAYFKALLFMSAGLVIHSFKGDQSILNMNMSHKQNPVLLMIMSSSILSMMGLPYLSGFYSKDQIVDSLSCIKDTSSVVYLFMIASFLCTALYSSRMAWYLMSGASNWHSMSDSDYEMIKPMIPLTILSVLGGSLSCWLLVDVEMFPDSSKVLILFLITATVLMYWGMSQVNSSEFLESKWNLGNFNPILSSSFFALSMKYQSSSDLLGFPEKTNKWISLTSHSTSALVGKTMVHYSGNLEFFMYLFVLTLVMWL